MGTDSRVHRGRTTAGELTTQEQERTDSRARWVFPGIEAKLGEVEASAVWALEDCATDLYRRLAQTTGVASRTALRLLRDIRAARLAFSCVWDGQQPEDSAEPNPFASRKGSGE